MKNRGWLKMANLEVTEEEKKAVFQFVGEKGGDRPEKVIEYLEAYCHWSEKKARSILWRMRRRGDTWLDSKGILLRT
jgi:hypothetical protein